MRLVLIILVHLREKLTNLLIILVYPTSGVILYNFPYILPFYLPPLKYINTYLSTLIPVIVFNYYIMSKKSCPFLISEYDFLLDPTSRLQYTAIRMENSSLTYSIKANMDISKFSCYLYTIYCVSKTHFI